MKCKYLPVTITAIFYLVFVLSCASIYNNAFNRFEKANQLHLQNNAGDALIEYCKILKQLSYSTDSSLKDRLLKAAIYHRFYLMNAAEAYQTLSPKMKVEHELILQKVSSTDKIGFLRMAFDENMSIENNPGRYTESSPVDTEVLIHKYLSIADKLLHEFDNIKNEIPALEPSIPLNFAEKIYTLEYLEIIKSFYLSAWARTFVPGNISPDKKYGPSNRQYLFDISLEHLNKIYFLLQDATDSLKTPEIQRLNELYRAIIYRLKDINAESSALILPDSSPDNIVYEFLKESIDKSTLILERNFHMNEARKKMNAAIEMIVTDKTDKAETYLLGALKNVICAKQFLPPNTPEEKKLFTTFISDIFLNLYRLSYQD